MPNLIPLSSIVIPPNRQRRVFSPEALQDLAVSISESTYGLLHPIVIRREDDKAILVAGERRFRAIQSIYSFGGTIRHANQEVPRELVPVVDLSDLDPIDASEAELEENIRREDLTVVEKAQAIALLVDLRKRQAEAKGLATPLTLDIAREVYDKDIPGGGQTIIKNQLMIARHADDPEVRKATSINEAVKVIKRKDLAERRAREAAIIGETFTSSLHTLLNQDCVEWLRQCPDGCFEVILSDPPYGIGADDFGDSGKSDLPSTHNYDDSLEAWYNLVAEVVPELYRVATPDSHLYLFCDIDRFHALKDLLEHEGWRVHRTPLIWSNVEGFRVPWQGQGPQRTYELILFAVKGKKKVNFVGKDVLTFARGKGRFGHPAQKPVSLLEELLRRSAAPGDRVLDPFAGTASTVEAANNLHLACTALESDPVYYAMALERIGGFEKELF